MSLIAVPNHRGDSTVHILRKCVYMKQVLFFFSALCISQPLFSQLELEFFGLDNHDLVAAGSPADRLLGGVPWTLSRQLPQPPDHHLPKVEADIGPVLTCF